MTRRYPPIEWNLSTAVKINKIQLKNDVVGKRNDPNGRLILFGGGLFFLKKKTLLSFIIIEGSPL